MSHLHDSGRDYRDVCCDSSACDPVGDDYGICFSVHAIGSDVQISDGSGAHSDHVNYISGHSGHKNGILDSHVPGVLIVHVCKNACHKRHHDRHARLRKNRYQESASRPMANC